MIFIDGDHSLAACYDDIRRWYPKLTREGRLLGHDAVPGSDVERAVRTFCREHGLTASVCPMPRTHYMWEIHQTHGD